MVCAVINVVAPTIYCTSKVSAAVKLLAGVPNDARAAWFVRAKDDRRMVVMYVVRGLCGSLPIWPGSEVSTVPEVQLCGAHARLLSLHCDDTLKMLNSVKLKESGFQASNSGCID